MKPRITRRSWRRIPNLGSGSRNSPKKFGLDSLHFYGWHEKTTHSSDGPKAVASKEGNLSDIITSLALVVFLVLVVRASKDRLETTLYVLGTMALTTVLGLGSAWVFPTVNSYAIGLGTRYAALLVGVLTALVHSRKTSANK